MRDDIVQTFLPYPDFAESARVLDRRRLGKQRVEAKQILLCLLGTGSLGWSRHPAVRMWRGHELTLARYGRTVCDEWIARGYRDTLKPWFASAAAGIMLGAASHEVTPPPWLGDAKFHASHRGNLLRKDPEFYGRLGWSESPDLSYVWPAPSDAGVPVNVNT